MIHLSVCQSVILSLVLVYCIGLGNVWLGKCKISMQVGEMVGRGIGTILLQIGELVIGQFSVGQN